MSAWQMAPHKSGKADKMKGLRQYLVVMLILPTENILVYTVKSDIPIFIGFFYFYFLDKNNYVIVRLIQIAISVTTISYYKTKEPIHFKINFHFTQ